MGWLDRLFFAAVGVLLLGCCALLLYALLAGRLA